jgi:hypothetical protein
MNISKHDAENPPFETPVPIPAPEEQDFDDVEQVYTVKLEEATAPLSLLSLLADLPAPWAKVGRVGAVLTGSLTLMVGADFGVSDVLPTLLSGPVASLAATAVGLGTLLLCLMAGANVIGKTEATEHESSEATILAALLGTTMAVPGLGGAFLVGFSTTAALGGGTFASLVGFGIGLTALATIGFTTWMAADPDPILVQALQVWRAPGLKA